VHLAVAVAVAFGVARVHAQSVDVTDCGDAGPGTLREAVSAGTAIAIHILGCPEIDLSSGPLVSALAYLHISGSPTMLRVTGPGRAITHIGNGGLDLVSLDVTGGDVVSDGTDIASGGCVSSGGYVSLTGTTVRECRVTATLQPPLTANSALGGGIFAVGSVFLDRSVVRDNTLVDAPGAYSASSGAMEKMLPAPSTSAVPHVCCGVRSPSPTVARASASVIPGRNHVSARKPLRSRRSKPPCGRT
jgi:hypothetical protein